MDSSPEGRLPLLVPRDDMRILQGLKRFSCNSGVGFLELTPNGQVSTKIELQGPNLA